MLSRPSNGGLDDHFCRHYNNFGGYDYQMVEIYEKGKNCVYTIYVCVPNVC